MDRLRATLAGHRDAWTFRAGPAAPAATVPVRGPLLISDALALHEAACAGLDPALLADRLIGDALAQARLVELLVVSINKV